MTTTSKGPSLFWKATKLAQSYANTLSRALPASREETLELIEQAFRDGCMSGVELSISTLVSTKAEADEAFLAKVRSDMERQRVLPGIEVGP